MGLGNDPCCCWPSQTRPCADCRLGSDSITLFFWRDRYISFEITASASSLHNHDHRTQSVNHETNLHRNPSAASLPRRRLHETIATMPISSTLAARLSSAPAPAPARRWSPYSRPSTHEACGGAAEARRPPMRLNPATTRLLGPAQKAAPYGSGCLSEVAASVAAAAPARRCPGYEMTNQESKPKPNLAEGDEKPSAEEKRGGGGFVFHCTLAGHTEVRATFSANSPYSDMIMGSIWPLFCGNCTTC